MTCGLEMEEEKEEERKSHPGKEQDLYVGIPESHDQPHVDSRVLSIYLLVLNCQIRSLELEYQDESKILTLECDMLTF